MAAELSYLGAYRSVTLDYYVRNRQAMQQAYPDLISFDTRFDADDALLTALLDFGREQDPELGKPSSTDRAEMAARAKAYLAKHLFDESAYHYVLRHRDDDYQKALEVLRDYSTSSKLLWQPTANKHRTFCGFLNSNFATDFNLIPPEKNIIMAFELPALPYAYDALEPHIDARTMEIHHGKHHNGYTQAQRGR